MSRRLMAGLLLVSAACSETNVPSPVDTAVTIAAAGDIASCDSDGDEQTARLLDSLPGPVLLLGDNAYPDGSTQQYADCYDPSWGRHRSRTRPVPGNHEYRTPQAAGYFSYFGSAAGEVGRGYYSFDVGSWHVVALNSSDSCVTVSCASGSEQLRWLRADLTAHSSLCALAYWHHPRFNSGAVHGNNLDVAPFWDLLYEFHVDVVLNGHEHVYERFGPQTPAGVPDSARGIRQFTVGSGGASHYTFGAAIQQNSEVRNADTFGVLALSLEKESYGWRFVPTSGGLFSDTGRARCR